MRLFVDTNIVLDYLDERPGYVGPARKLMILGFLHELDLFYLLTNGGRASEATEVKRTMQRARQFIRVCSLNEADVDAALDSTWNDFEDACVYQCALKLKADAIITRNRKDFEKSSIRVLDCEELFDYLAEEKGLVYEEIPF